MAAPINDNFADAIEVEILTIGATFSDSVGSTNDATMEPGELSNTTDGSARSVWWKYTPAHSGPVVVTEDPSNNNAALVVFTGSAVNALNVVANPGRNASQAEFDAQAGVTYYIRHAMRSTSYSGSGGIIVDGETTVVSRAPAAPTLSIIPEDDTLLVKWSLGYMTTWEIQLDSDPIISLGAVDQHLFVGLTIGNTYTIKVRGTNSFGSGSWTTRTILMPNMLVFDTFDRANSTSVVGAPTVGSAPTSHVGTWGINSNQLYPSAVSSNNAYLTWETGTANVDIRATCTATHANARFVFGFTSTSDFWNILFRVDDTCELQHYRSGAFVVHHAFRGGPDLIGQQWRFVHHNGFYQAWAGSTLLGQGQLPPGTVGTRHGLRATSTGVRWDDLTIRESSEITLEAQDAAMVTQTYAARQFDPPEITSFLYKGRDTKAQDSIGVA